MLSGKRSKSQATDSSPDTPAPKRAVGECSTTQTAIYRPPVPPKPKHLTPDKLKKMAQSSEGTNIEQIKPAFDKDTPIWAKQIWDMVKQTSMTVNKMSDSLKESFTHLEDKISTATKKANDAHELAVKCQQEVNLLKDENENLRLKLRTAEAYSKKNNLIFLNIPESDNETPAVLKRKLSDVCVLLDIDIRDMCIDNIHRLPGPSHTCKPLIVKFASFLDRDIIWNRKEALRKKNSKVIIKQHLPAEVEKEVKQLLPIRRAAKEMGFNVKIVNEKGIIVVNGQAYRVSTLHTLPAPLRPENVAVRVVDGHLFFFTGAVPLSNFWGGEYKVDGVLYKNGEQYIQEQKAVTFNDERSRKLIMKATTPQEMHAIGQNIENYSEARWREHAQEITLKGLEEKFRQNKVAKEYLLNTGTNKLVEASPSDSWWGIGVNLYDKDIMRKKDKWGSNILGNILMTIRQRLTGEKPYKDGEGGTLV